MTGDEARAVYLAQPGAVEGEHHGHPDFRVNGKIFGSLFPDKAVAVVRLPLEAAEMLAEERANLYRLVSRAQGMGWLQINLSEAELPDIAPLVELACETRRSP